MITAKHAITKKINLQQLFYVGSGTDHRLFHVELRDIFVTPEQLILREFFYILVKLIMWAASIRHLM